MASDDGNDKDGIPPERDPSHWGDYDEAAWPVMELYGYRNTEVSGNMIYNKIIESFGCINYRNPPEDVHPYALALKIMFRQCAAVGELDFDP